MPRRISVERQKKIERKLDKSLISKAPITSFDACPHCRGSYGYYVKTVTEGILHDNTAWDHVSKQNSEMHDSLSDIWTSKYYYCGECDQPICYHDEKSETQKFLDALPNSI